MRRRWESHPLRGGLELRSRRALGTTAQVVTTAGDPAEHAVAAVDRVLDEVDRLASRFRADSELQRINLNPLEEMEVSPRFAELLAASLQWARVTCGLLDPTVGAAVIAAGYVGDFDTIEREQEAPLPLRCEVPGWWRVELSGTRLRRPAGVLLDLGSTAKAQAADAAAASAGRAGRAGVLVSLGGDIATAGPLPHEGWPVRVTDDHRSPAAAGGQTVALVARGLATSSRVVRRWRRSGREAHHLVDPRTGTPAEGPWRSVSVAAATCLAANAYSTAALVGGETGRALLESARMAARLVTVEGRVIHLGGWTAAGEEPALAPGAAA